MNSEHYLAAGLAPSLLTLLEPSATPACVGIDWGSPEGARTVTVTRDTSTGEICEIETSVESDSVSRILRATSDACSRWFRVVRAAIGRERDRQQKFRVEHDLPKSTRIPYQKPVVEQDECASWQAAESTLRCLYGDGVADYAHEKFVRAIETGDMRAFKIRLIVLKARDSLAGTPLVTPFVAGIEKCISTAEETAGCTPDPSPRRLSRAEQERRQRKQNQQQQQENCRHNCNTDAAIAGKESDRKDPDRVSVGGKQEEKCDTSIQDIEKSETGSDSSQSGSAKGRFVKTSKKSITCKSCLQKNNNLDENCDEDVTVTSDQKSSVIANSRKQDHSSPVRKTRNYETVDEVLSDVESGLIDLYETTDEIYSDVKAGVLTEAEAILFTIALDQYSPMDDGGVDQDIDFDVDDDEKVQDIEDPEEDDGNEVEDDHDQPISYNPQGFAGCCGNYSGSGMNWNPDDE